MVVYILSKSNWKIQIHHDRALCRKRHKTKNMVGKLKAWRSKHTRYDQCAHTFLFAFALAAKVGFDI
jgi:transposase